MRFRVLALALCLAPLSGCLTLAGGQLHDVETTAPAEPQPLEQTVGAFSFHLDGGKMVTSNKAGRVLNDEILRRWVERGYIRSHEYVKDSAFTGGSALRLTLSGHQEGESSIVLQVFSGLTLLIIPYYVDSQMQVTYTLENATTGCKFTGSVSDSYNTVVGLLLFPALPFSGVGRGNTFERMSDHLYQQLASQSAFENSTACNLSGPRSDAAHEEPAR